jgi:hypothetical protein
MAIHYRRISDYLRRALAGRSLDHISRLKPRHDLPPPHVPGGSTASREAIAERDGHDDDIREA